MGYKHLHNSTAQGSGLPPPTLPTYLTSAADWETDSTIQLYLSVLQDYGLSNLFLFLNAT